MFDAYRKIYKTEGFSGLYRGFWISSIQIVSGVFYVSTYEGVRHLLGQDPITSGLDSRVKALIGGGAASAVGQTIVVPFDVLSQHMMVLGISTKHGKLVVDKVPFLSIGKLPADKKSSWQEGLNIMTLIILTFQHKSEDFIFYFISESSTKLQSW